MTGQVNVTLFYGTRYDWLNIPYDPADIARTATKTKSLPGMFVWETTFMDQLRVNVDDYNDIVGAQWARVDEVDASQHYGSHWYYVLSYQQDTPKSCTLTLKYDALLSIGVNAISSISGIAQRWTVADDTDPFAWVMTDEPINQADPFVYTYQTVDPTSGPNMSQLIGAPVDLEKQPEILNYQNPSGEDANIFYPDMEAVGTETAFASQYPATRVIQNGLQFYFWQGDATAPVKKNYSLAVGLGYDLTTQAYAMPQSDLIQYSASGLKLTRITGNANTFATGGMAGTGLTKSGWNNAKTRSMGIWFTLYNPMSGDSVDARNYELSKLGVTVWPDVTPSGRFYARFTGYMSDNTGTSGNVCSSQWLPVTLTSGVGAGSIRAEVNNEVARQEIQTNYQTARRTIETQTVSGAIGGALTALMGASGAINPAMIASGLLTMAQSVINGITAAQNLEQTTRQQRESLRITGTLSTNTPPGVKFGNVNSYTSDSFKFYIRAASFSDRDRERADEYFTAWGYNVDRLPLTDVAMLNARERFTFIMADHVRITAGASLTRIEDARTVSDIEERFANGIRIWNVSPDYDYTIPNPTKGG